MSVSRSPILRFGPFQIDLHSGELSKNGTRLRLQPQPLRVLALLASRAGDVLSRMEIEREIWGNETHVDFNVGLNYCIKQIREVLEDDASKPAFIETLPRRGYRFISSIAKHERPASRKRLMLAVLPFSNLTGDAEQEYFADGMTEEIIGQLGRLKPQKLGVIAFTSAMAYKQTTKGIDQIGRELGVDFILEGSVRRAGDRVRIAAQLIQVSDQTHLWAEAYNRTIEDIISIQVDVAERVARSLALELLADHQESMTRAATRTSVAYEAYLKGCYYWNKRTEDGFRKALVNFSEAIAKDPNYAPAYVGVADVYNIIAFYSGVPPREAYEKSKAATTKALQLDEALAEAYTAAAYAKALYGWEFAEAEKTFRRALDLNPNQVTGHYWFALFLAGLGRLDEAFVLIDRALELDPLSPVINCHKGWILYFARRYDLALVQLRNVIDMDPNFALARYFIGLVYVQKGAFDQAIIEFKGARDISENHPAALAGLAACLALTGKRAESHRLLQKLMTLAKRRYVAPYYIAAVHLACGERQQAFRWLEKSFGERSAYMTNLMHDPALDSIRSEPEFQHLVRRVGLAGK
jgi:TolB-like protein/Flp pilus assembly protein TadD